MHPVTFPAAELLRRTANDMRSATLAIQMTFKGATRTIELSIPGEIINGHHAGVPR
jgi:hypothetical protein